MNILLNKMKTLILLHVLLTLVACGGGGGGGESNSSNSTPSSSTEAAETETETAADMTDTNVSEADTATINNIVEDIEPAVIEMDELVAEKTFSFTTKQRVNVDINLAEYANSRAYVSIYQHYNESTNGQFEAEPQTRILAGALIDGKFNQTFIAVEPQEQYLLEIWFYDDSPVFQQALTLNGTQLSL